MRSDEQKPGILAALTSFFTGVGGLLTAIAAVTTAALGFVAFVNRDDGGATPPTVPGTTQPSPFTTTLERSGPTLADWRAQADAICGGADLDFEISPEAPNNQALQVLEVGRQTVTLFRNTSDSIGDLDTPASHEDEIDEMLSSWQRAADALEHALDALQRGDEQSMLDEQSRAQGLAAQGNRLARRLGATTCTETVFGER